MLIKESLCYSLATQMSQTTRPAPVLVHGKWKHLKLTVDIIVPEKDGLP